MATPIWQARPVAPACGAQQPALHVPQSYWGAPGKNNSQVQPPRFPFGTPSGSQPASYVQCSARPAYRGPTQMTGSEASNQPPPPTEGTTSKERSIPAAKGTCCAASGISSSLWYMVQLVTIVDRQLDAKLTDLPPHKDWEFALRCTGTEQKLLDR